MSIKLGNTNIPFVFRGNEVIHPAPVKDGLVLWYDFSGRTNDDAQRDVAEDLSGNGNHGTLQNFNYTDESGYDKNKLSFDGVDDFIDAPIEELNLDPDNMTAQIDNMIYSYKDEQVMYTKLNDVKTELEGIEVAERNLVLDSVWNITNNAYLMQRFHTSVDLKFGEIYTITVYGELGGDRNSFRLYSHAGFGDPFIPVGAVTNGYLNEIRDGVHQLTFIYTEDERTTDHFRHIIFQFPNGGMSESSIDRIQIVKGDINTNWTPAPEDNAMKITTIQEQQIQSYKLYNRALTEEEIAHNYAIEKERFNIE